mgnify:CR=1 FL=1
MTGRGRGSPIVIDPENRRDSPVGNLGTAVLAGIAAEVLTDGFVGFAVVFLLLYWLFGGSL